MLKRPCGLAFVLFLSLVPPVVAGPLRITGRILGLPSNHVVSVELRPLVSGYADGLRQLAGDPVPLKEDSRY